MGHAELALGDFRRHTKEEHQAFMAREGLLERGDKYTAARRSLLVAEALATAPGLINPDLRYRQRR